MKKLILSALAALIVNIASAASITIGQAIELRAGLTALDGYQKDVPQGDAPAKVIVSPYKLSSDTRWKIFSALTAIKPTLETFDAARADLQKRVKLAGDDKAALAAIDQEAEQLLARKQDVKLPTLKREELALGGNPIPGSVLVALAPIIAEK